MIEYKLESFELSGLVRDFSALPRHDQLPKDYQVRIMADHGLAFNSSAKQQMQCDMQSVQLKRLAAAGNNGGTSNNSSANNLIISPLAGNSNNIPFSGANDGTTPNSAQGTKMSMHCYHFNSFTIELSS